MAYVNVADWKPDRVADWLKGLDLPIHKYVESFLNNHVNGQHLLNLQPDDLEHHGIYKVGHQEIILEAVDHLRNFHYELDHENLQLLALRVSCLAHSLHKELQWNSSPSVSTQTLSDVATLIKAVKPLVYWLNRPPFSGQLAYIDKKAEFLTLSLEMAFIGQRGTFADYPIETIRKSAKRLSELADEMIREIHDPLLLQPSSLDLATLKKRPGDHLGFFLTPSFHGIHQIGDVTCNSSAYLSGKIECGDEIVQINYQTVVGWDVKQVMALFEESSSDVFLTLKKRPCHSKILGQIYMKPYRLPSKKQVSYGWFLGDSVTPTRINMGGHFDIKPLGHKLINSVTSFNKNRKPLTESFESNKGDVIVDNKSQSKIVEKEESGDTLEEDEDEGEEEDDDEDNEPEEESISSPTSVRLYLPKPRLPVQRRATITGTGASPTSKQAPLNLEQLWNELKLEREWRLCGKQRKGEKSTSEILLSTTSPSEVGSVESKINLKSAPKACSADCLKSVQSEFVKKNKPVLHLLDSKLIAENEIQGKLQKETDQEPKKVNDPSLTEEANMFIPLKARIDIFNKKFDDSSVQSSKPKIPTKRCVQSEGFMSLTNSPAHRNTEKKPVARPRGKLDKSNSTPVYDFNDRSQGWNEIELLLNNKLKSRNNQVPLKPELFEKLVPTQVDNNQKSCDTLELSNVNGTASKSSTITIANREFDILKDEILSSESNTQYETSNSRQSHMSTPKPAVRTIKKDSRDLLSDSDVKSKSVLFQTEMHVSDSKDSVFIEDEFAVSTPVPASNSLEQLVSPEQKIIHSNPLKEHSGKLSISSVSHKMKFIDDPESPTDPLNSKAPVVKPREFFSNSSPRKSPTHATVIISNPDSPVPPSLHSKKQVSLINVVKSSEGSKLGPITITGHLSLNKEDLPLEIVADESPSNISYMTENIVQVSVPHNQTRTFPKINLISSSSAEAINKVHFASSTPIKKKICQETSFCQQSSTYPRNKPEIKSVLPGPSTSQSSSLRAIIPLKSKHQKTTSPKVFRKKNSLLLGKRRNISVKDLVMPDCEGWLFQRDRKISTVPQWIRGWFVIKGNHFYGFTDKDSPKAHLFIYLPGFTVAPAIEVKSRKYALKIYHTGTTFYLAADSQDEFASWLGCLSQAVSAHDHSPVENITFSESEGEDKSDSDKSKELCFSSPKVKKMSNFLTGPLSSSSSKNEKKFSSLKKKKDDSHHSSEHGNSSLDRKYLRFLSGTNNIPVPTEHFRSYRRVPPANMIDKLPLHDTSVTSVESVASRTSSPPLQLPPEMADYRLAHLARAGHTMNRQREHNTTLEAFMMSRQGEERRQNQTASALRPPQHVAPSVPNLQSDEAACRVQLTRQCIPSTSQKDSDCRMNNPLHHDWSESLGQSSHSRNCNTIPDIQTKRLKKITSGNSNVQVETCGDSTSLTEFEDDPERSQFQRNSHRSSSSSKLKSFFTSSHWQDSSSKGILGSPRLRRVLFPHKCDANNRGNASKCHPNSNCPNESGDSVSRDFGQHTPDYPDLEYPPVFVPESYSLSYVTSILEARASPNSNYPHDSETASNEGDPPSPS